jgi:hypothetical protein
MGRSLLLFPGIILELGIRELTEQYLGFETAIVSPGVVYEVGRPEG